MYVSELAHDDDGEFDNKIASYMANEKHGIERKLVAIDYDKRELQNKINKLEDDLLKVPSHVKGISIKFKNEFYAYYS